MPELRYSRGREYGIRHRGQAETLVMESRCWVYLGFETEILLKRNGGLYVGIQTLIRMAWVDALYAVGDAEARCRVVWSSSVGCEASRALRLEERPGNLPMRICRWPLKRHFLRVTTVSTRDALSGGSDEGLAGETSL